MLQNHILVFSPEKLKGERENIENREKLRSKASIIRPQSPEIPLFTTKDSENLHFLQIFSEWGKAKLAFLSGKKRDDKREDRGRQEEKPAK